MKKAVTLIGDKLRGSFIFHGWHGLLIRRSSSAIMALYRFKVSVARCPVKS